MGVDQEFERVRTSLRTEEQALAREFEQIDADARAAVDASVQQVRTELATQADRIREAIAQQREEVEARSQELLDELETAEPSDGGEDGSADDGTSTDDDVSHAAGEVDQPDGTGIEQVSPADDEPGETIGDVERGD